MQQVSFSEEDARVQAVRDERILDSGPEATFDDLVLIAAETFRVPVALINFVDRDHQSFKARIGVDAHQAPRSAGFCPVVVDERRPLIVEDTSSSPEWVRRAATIGQPIRFYAGVPIVAPSGHVLGTVCIADTEPRTFGPHQRAVLEAIARQVVAHLDMRRNAGAEERLRRSFEDASVGMAIVSPRGQFLRVNQAFQTLLGYTEPELLERSFSSVTHPDDVEVTAKLLRATLDGYQTGFRVEKRYVHQDGHVIWALLATSLVRDGDGLPWYWVTQIQDITERKRAETDLRRAHGDMERRVEERTAELRQVNEGLRTEVRERQVVEEALRRSQEQLVQSQKLQAVGQLAGGIAHEFNNLLTVMFGYLSVLEMDFDEEDPRRSDIRHIADSADRAALLTRQLLAFSRHQRLAPQLVDLNTLLVRQERMLARVIGENVSMTLVLSDGDCPVRVDPAHVEQVMLNLAINARDAMPDGGEFQISTRTLVVDEDDPAAWGEIDAGPYIAMTVSDTGEGMTPEVQSRIFEPFFTTKDVGKGTGLGLSTVYGIVAQSGGYIRVESRPGAGSTFTVLLPRIEPAMGSALREVPRATPRGSETILLVEDEPALRGLTAAALRRHGYWVLEAAHGVEALGLCARQAGPIHLLITDIVMPGMTGTGLAKRLLPTRPEARVLYMSGYTTDASTLGLGPDVDFMSKPFTPDELLDRVRRLLDRRDAMDRPVA